MVQAQRDELKSSFETEIVLFSELERGERKQNSKTVAMLKCTTVWTLTVKTQNRSTVSVQSCKIALTKNRLTVQLQKHKTATELFNHQNEKEHNCQNGKAYNSQNA